MAASDQWEACQQILPLAYVIFVCSSQALGI
jgi:hypothetical protein